MEKTMTENKAKKIKISMWGGFHNVGPINIMVDSRFVDALENVEFEGDYLYLDSLLSPGQQKKLDRHFCGVEGCQCGSWHRDFEWERCTK